MGCTWVRISTLDVLLQSDEDDKLFLLLVSFCGNTTSRFIGLLCLVDWLFSTCICVFFLFFFLLGTSTYKSYKLESNVWYVQRSRSHDESVDISSMMALECVYAYLSPTVLRILSFTASERLANLESLSLCFRSQSLKTLWVKSVEPEVNNTASRGSDLIRYINSLNFCFDELTSLAVSSSAPSTRSRYRNNTRMKNARRLDVMTMASWLLLLTEVFPDDDDSSDDVSMR